MEKRNDKSDEIGAASAGRDGGRNDNDHDDVDDDNNDDEETIFNMLYHNQIDLILPRPPAS